MAYPPCPPGAPDLGLRPHDKFGEGELGRRVKAARSGQVKNGPVRLPAAGLVAIEADFKVDKTQNRVGPVESGSQILCSTPQIAAEVARLAIGRIQPGQVPRPAFVGKKGLVADTAKSRVTWEKYAGDGTEFAELFAVLPIGDGRDTGLTFADAALVTSGSRGCVPAADANAVPSTTHLKCMPRSAEAGQYTAQEAIYKSPGTLEAGVLAKDRGCVFVEGLLDPIVKDSHLKLGVE
jgi:hypothetical protein